MAAVVREEAAPESPLLGGAEADQGSARRAVPRGDPGLDAVLAPVAEQIRDENPVGVGAEALSPVLRLEDRR